MDTDLTLTIGLALGCLAIAFIASALAQVQLPRKSALLGLVAGGLIWLAVAQSPEGYAAEDIPEVVLGVIARFL